MTTPVYCPAPYTYIPGMVPGSTEENYSMRSSRLGFALALSLGMVAAARAGTYSSPLLSAPTGRFLDCVVSNVGTKTANVAVAMYDINGNLLVPSDTCLGFNGVLPAGQTCSGRVVGPSTGTRCTVGASGKVRVEMVVVDSTGNITASMAATK